MTSYLPSNTEPPSAESPRSALPPANAKGCQPTTSCPPIRLTAPSRASRIPPRRSRGSHCGTIVAMPTPRALHYESKLEANVAVVLLARPDFVDLQEQLPALSYIDLAGKPSKIHFDLLLKVRNGSRIAISVKPRQLAEKTNHAATIKHIAKQMPRRFATHAMLMTEYDASDAAVYNAPSYCRCAAIRRARQPRSLPRRYRRSPGT